MRKIIEIEIQPATQCVTLYMVGHNNNVRIKGFNRQTAPTVSDIEIHADERTGNPVIEIKVDGETYCIYENVPYVVYYETSFHQSKENDDAL